MSRLEQRVKRLEEEAPQESCSHPPITYLTEPTAEELAKVEEKLDACPNCHKGESRPLIVILKSYA